MTRRSIFAALLSPFVGCGEIKEEPKKEFVANLVIDEKTLEKVVDKAIERFLTMPISTSTSCATSCCLPTSGTYTTNWEAVRVDEGPISNIGAGL